MNSNKYHYSSLILVTFKSIQDVPFPSVTVCAPNSGKWQALVEALNHYDEDGLIFEVLQNKKSIRNLLKGPFNKKDWWGPTNWIIEKVTIVPEMYL